MTPQQYAALSAACASLGEPFNADAFKLQDNGWIGAFVGPAYVECSPAGEVSLWCDCDPEVPYGSCTMCPDCSRHLVDCLESRCGECGLCAHDCEGHW